mmetsp:Transcript_1621/g.6389  ORF Transcript_1621/g.6389 Transcript_1621/m.6389 type:complete len:204 (-) Transcript_1621:388-999(-)
MQQMRGARKIYNLAVELLRNAGVGRHAGGTEAAEPLSKWVEKVIMQCLATEDTGRGPKESTFMSQSEDFKRALQQINDGRDQAQRIPSGTRTKGHFIRQHPGLSNIAACVRQHACRDAFHAHASNVSKQEERLKRGQPAHAFELRFKNKRERSAWTITITAQSCKHAEMFKPGRTVTQHGPGRQRRTQHHASALHWPVGAGPM